MAITLRDTRPLEKLFTSAINVAVALVFLVPFFWVDFSALELKWIFIGLFLLQNLVAISFFDYRLPGMVVQNTQWKHPYPLPNQLVHALLYSASFATLLFWVWFPGDLLLINLLLLQWPCIQLTGTTMHGWLSGGMKDVKLSQSAP